LTFEVEYDTASDKIYELEDLTMRSWLQLASNIAKSKKGGKSSDLDDNEFQPSALPEQESGKGKKREKVWFTFVKRAFVGTIEEGDVKDQFGWR